MNLNFVAIIPSRFGSSRFPGKPLADIGGKMMIQRVYEQVIQAVKEAWVATDDERIVDAVRSFGGKAVMTSTLHRSGTDRCAEAVRRISEETGTNFDVVINVQGDEPFIHPSQITSLQQPFNEHPSTEIATLIQRIHTSDMLFDKSEAKVALDTHGNALYFSRLPIPMIFKSDEMEWISQFAYYCHVGIYAYRTDILQKLSQLPEGQLEKAESLEQLRWLENGYKIKTMVTSHTTVSIDTPDDLARILAIGPDQFYAQP